MKKILVLMFLGFSVIFSNCSQKNLGALSKEETDSTLVEGVPVISFTENLIDIGEMKEGEFKEVVYEFVNSGTVDLLIELVTACKCTEIKWPTQPIPPGQRGKIVANFDSKGMDGAYTKTLDIIANTDPIVVEAKFSVVVKK